ncbi:MAG: Dam family site-specific DNA-(adenine-N6)-methyltransferase [Pseudomonadota bacterium]
MRPLLRWAGSKRQLVAQLSEYWIAATPKRYVEPFAGSAALFFEINPKRALINDVNSELISFYRGMKRTPELIYEMASSFKIDAETYYGLRSTYSEETDSVRKCASFYYLNRFCFNGIYRTNAAGKFNVPFAKSYAGQFPKWEEVDSCVTQLRKASTRSRDFEKLVSEEVEAGDFVYLDPPYAVQNKKVFTQYNATTFGLNDLERLREILKLIEARGANFVLSYAHCDEALEYFSDWSQRSVQCQRNIAGFAKHRRKADELLFTNIDLGGVKK